MQNLSYDLNTWKCDKIPKLRYVDNPETWSVKFTGRALEPVVGWRAAVETSRKSGTPCVIARIESGFSLSGDTLTFPADCFWDLFRDAVRAFDSGRELNFALYGLDASGKTTEYIEFEILGFPAVDPPDSDPKSLPVRPATTVNGLSGAVVLTDGDGNPFPVNGQTVRINAGGGYDGLFPDRNPVAQIPVLDATLGVCHYLDATFPEISLAYPVWKLREIRALVRSVNAAITGTVEVTPYIDDAAQTPVTINVGATWAAVTIPLIVETGAVRLVRTGGTLADGSWVTAAFRAITAMVAL